LHSSLLKRRAVAGERFQPRPMDAPSDAHMPFDFAQGKRGRKPGWLRPTLRPEFIRRLQAAQDA